ncbi:MAG: galactokinase [Candidatus Nanopelagicales bacterium]
MRLFQAPGRANLIGDHTDYMGGMVMPMAIDRGTWLWARARPDRVIRATSANFPEAGVIEVDMDLDAPAAEAGWVNYLVAMVSALRKRGSDIPHGFDVLVRGSIPNGAGLSSSASLELAFGVALNEILELGVTPTELAQAGQVAENDFIGVSSGIMDQLIIALGEQGNALAMDCETLEVEAVPMPASDVVVVANSRKRRGLVDSEYNARRSAAESAERSLGVGRLVDIAPADLDGLLERLAPELRGPARHVATEQHRVLAAVDALRAGDRVRMGELMRQSHESLRDDYRVTGPELDALVEAAWAAPGCVGARMTGAGFGGCTVNLVEEAKVTDFIAAVGPEYTRRTGLEPEFFVVRSADGAQEITDPNELAANDPAVWGVQA